MDSGNAATEDPHNPVPATIDALLRIPGFAAYEGAYYRNIVDIVLDGAYLRNTGLRIGDLPLDFGLTQDQENAPQEILAVANVLAFLGHSKVTVTKRDRPDFVATLPAGTVHIEHTRAYTGYQQGSERHFYRDIHALRTDPDFRAAIGNTTILLTIGRSPIDRTPVAVLEDPVPQGFMSNRDAAKLVAEIRALAKRGYFRALVGQGSQTVDVDGFPMLAKFRATVDVDSAVADAHIGIQVSIMTWKPGHLSLFDACAKCIEDKAEKVSKYPILPDWLVIQAVAPPDIFVFDLAQYQMNNLGPFKMVFVLYPHIDGRFYLANFTADADGAVQATIPELPELEMPFDGILNEWALSVNEVLQARQIMSRRAPHTVTNVAFPKMMTSPMQIQWYRKWMGPHPWVTCSTRGELIRMHFWWAGEWYNGRSEDLFIDDFEGAADRIWDFINSDAGPTPAQTS